MVKTKNIFTYFLTIFVLQSVLPVLTRHIDYPSSKCYKDLNKLKNTCNADIDHYSKSLNKLTNEITQLTSSKLKYEICINKPELKKCSDDSGRHTYSYRDNGDNTNDDYVKTEKLKIYHYYGTSRQSLERSKLAHLLHILNSGQHTYSFGDKSYPSLDEDKLEESYEKLVNDDDNSMSKFDSEKVAMEKCQLQLTNEKAACETRVNNLILKNK